MREKELKTILNLLNRNALPKKRKTVYVHWRRKALSKRKREKKLNAKQLNSLKNRPK